ncbi:MULTISPECIES: porin [unclassified Caballeronia]|uniref:porin n=1 Tax=unclassified Caballeronia TaxID=2646786 RepID=UPI00285E18A4|nr:MULTISPECIES: porin [unclassified Caballeronia]MDR5812991.1 porin [Caballeronia sp. LZ033]MDR5877613.1 porin [Caballeronia sp. LZ032]
MAVAASLLGVPCAAWAQSSVQLYGELDSGLAWTSNVGGHSQYRLTTGTIDGSYWGLQGSEDLGGGARAIFRLERGLSVATGEGLNDHPIYVGIGSDRLGTVTFGRQYDSIHDYFQTFTLTGNIGGTAFAHLLDNDNANNSFLASNSVKYTSASYGGFSFGGLYAFSNEAGAFSDNRAYSVGANYSLGSFNAGAAYLHNNGRGNTTTGAYEALALPGTTQGSVFTANVQQQNTFGVGMSYELGEFTLSGAFSRAINSGVIDADSGDLVPSLGLNNYEINGIYKLTPAIMLAGMYVYTNGGGAHWHEGALQVDYLLSKRTDVYLESIYQRASSNAPAVINTNDPSSGRNQLMIGTGIRHRF